VDGIQINVIIKIYR